MKTNGVLTNRIEMVNCKESRVLTFLAFAPRQMTAKVAMHY